MLGEIKPDLKEILGIDTACLHGTSTMFGFPAVDFKEWQLHDGTPVLVPVDFNTVYEPNGDLLQYPSQGDPAACPPAGICPREVVFLTPFSARSTIVEDSLNPEDNMDSILFR